MGAGGVDGGGLPARETPDIDHPAEPPVSHISFEITGKDALSMDNTPRSIQGRWKQNLWASRTAGTLNKSAERNEPGATPHSHEGNGVDEVNEAKAMGA